MSRVISRLPLASTLKLPSTLVPLKEVGGALAGMTWGRHRFPRRLLAGRGLRPPARWPGAPSRVRGRFQPDEPGQAGGERQWNQQEDFLHARLPGKGRGRGPGRGQAGVLQAVGVLAVDADRAGLEQAGEAEDLVHLVQVVHPVVVADHHAQVRTAGADQAVVGGAVLEGQRRGAEEGVARIEEVGQRRGTAPGVIAHAVDLVGAFAAGRGGDALRVLGVEARGTLAVQRLQRAVNSAYRCCRWKGS